MDDAIARLIHGFRSFRNIYFSGDAELFDQLKHGQNPRILVIACSDSRVDPALLTQSAPGDLFVIRNVANLVPPCEPDTRHHGVSAALEYAVTALEVEHIIVLGHSDCGGIHALMKRTPERPAGEFLERWLDLAEPARRAVQEKLPDADEMTRRHACEEASLVLALEKHGVTAALGDVLTSPRTVAGTLLSFGGSSFLAANLVNNIPMSVLYRSVISALPAGTENGTAALYAAVVGSNLGAFFTPMGALAGIMWTGQLRDHGVPFSFGSFVRYGAAVAIPALTAALLGLWIVL